MQSTFRKYSEHRRWSRAEEHFRAAGFAAHMLTRRTVRDFSSEPVDSETVDECLRVALSAPSGANQQPWKYVVVSNPGTRKELREAAEAEEREFYQNRAPDEWLKALSPFGTNSEKPFLETAPIVICVFAETWGQMPDGRRRKHYYVSESVGISVGFLLASLHYAGLATLTHTPSPMQFLNRLLKRPENERPFLIVVAGYPAEGCLVPDISKRRMDESVIRI
ncbi:MAG: nitroreductase family protein [Planctomyces sp.]|nr:nitroreductase family protein [Planctomyces sp.]